MKPSQPANPITRDQMFVHLLEAAPDAMMIINSQGVIVLANSQLEKLFGWARAEVQGQSVETLVPQRFRNQHEQHRTGYFADLRVRPMGSKLELFGLRRDGSEYPVDISLSPLQTDGEVLVIAAVRDISERKQAEELRRANAELEQFAYVASHDLQEPLRMVASFAQLLAKRYQGRLDADADEFIGYVVDGATRMQQLINSLLSYSRVGTHGQQFAPNACDAVLDEVLRNLAVTIEENAAEITRDPLPTVMGDELQLAQLFQNLISNAIRYRQEQPPRIHISARRREADWLFSVRDNGIGMESQYFERIFLIFQQLHTRAEYPGTGIGLAICKKIVERHSGRIWVESEPGQGSTFFFTLPVSREV